MSNQFGDLEHIQNTIFDLAITFGPKILVAITIILVGVFAGGWVAKVVDGGLRKFNLDQPVRQLLVRIVRIFVLVIFVIMALQNLGVQLLPLIAGLGVAGAGIALAMQGVLSNIVAGLTIIFTKPFRVGEYISIVGEEGQVNNISIFTTVLSHADQSLVVIPNRKLVGEILHNYGNIRQLDVVVSVAYDTDLEVAVSLIKAILQSNPHALKDPAPLVSVNLLAPSGINIVVNPWVNVPDYSLAKGEINQEIVKTFRTHHIDIACSQLDLRMLQANDSTR